MHQPYVVTETTFDKGVTRGWALRTPHYKYVLYDKGLYREQLYDMERIVARCGIWPREEVSGDTCTASCLSE